MLVSTGGLGLINSKQTAISTSYTFDGEFWSTGVVSDLPEAVGTHCLIKIDEDELIAVGGTNTQGTILGSSHFYNGKKNQWTKGPTLSETRYLFYVFLPRHNPVTTINLVF